MPRRAWTVTVGGEAHDVEVHWARLTNAGRIVVDGDVVEAWGFSVFGPTVHFKVAGQAAILQPTMSGFDLYVGGKKARKL
jgi:hypothetical protein